MTKRLFDACKAICDSAGKTQHRPLGKKAYEAAVFPWELLEDLRAAMADDDLSEAAGEYLLLCERLIPEHIAFSPDHEYGKAEDRLRTALGIPLDE